MYVSRGANSGEILFTHSKLKENIFLPKSQWENIKFQNPGRHIPHVQPSDAHVRRRLLRDKIAWV